LFGIDIDNREPSDFRVHMETINSNPCVYCMYCWTKNNFFILLLLVQMREHTFSQPLSCQQCQAHQLCRARVRPRPGHNRCF